MAPSRAKIRNMDFLEEAISRFNDVFDRASRCGLKEPTAMTLATSTLSGRPSIRTLLLKSFDRHGFVFFTNFESRKGRELISNPQAALCFHWQPLEEQVIVEGVAMPTTHKEADEYWASRPRESQIGGWASLQSRPLEDRATLEKRVNEMMQKFGKKKIPRPPHWSGFRLIPNRIEFWKAQPFRLHERTVYENKDKGWQKGNLYP